MNIKYKYLALLVFLFAFIAIISFTPPIGLAQSVIFGACLGIFGLKYPLLTLVVIYFLEALAIFITLMYYGKKSRVPA